MKDSTFDGLLEASRLAANPQSQADLLSLARRPEWKALEELLAVRWANAVRDMTVRVPEAPREELAAEVRCYQRFYSELVQARTFALQAEGDVE